MKSRTSHPKDEAQATPVALREDHGGKAAGVDWTHLRLSEGADSAMSENEALEVKPGGDKGAIGAGQHTRRLRGAARPKDHHTPVEPLVSIEGFALTLGVSRRVVERLRAEGSIPPADLYIGRLPRWRPETVRQWIQDQVETTGRID